MPTTKFPCSGTGVPLAGGMIKYHEDIIIKTDDEIKLQPAKHVLIRPESGKIELTDIAGVTTMLGCRGPNFGFALWPDLDDNNSSRMVIKDRGQADEESIRFEERSINIDKSEGAVTMRHYGIHYQQDSLEHTANGVMNLYDALAYVTSGILNDNRDIVAIRSTVYNPSGTLNDSRNCLRLQQRNTKGNGSCVVVEQSGAGDAIKFEGTGTGEGVISRDSGNIELKTTTSGDIEINPASANLNLFTGTSLASYLKLDYGTTGAHITTQRVAPCYLNIGPDYSAFNVRLSLNDRPAASGTGLECIVRKQLAADLWAGYHLWKAEARGAGFVATGTCFEFATRGDATLNFSAFVIDHWGAGAALLLNGIGSGAGIIEREGGDLDLRTVDAGSIIRFYSAGAVRSPYVAAGNFYWGAGAALKDDQGGSIQLGHDLTGGATPYIDFHYGTGFESDFNVRVINAGDNELRITDSAGNSTIIKNGFIGIAGVFDPTAGIDSNQHILLRNTAVATSTTQYNSWRVVFRASSWDADTSTAVERNFKIFNRGLSGSGGPCEFVFLDQDDSEVISFSKERINLNNKPLENRYNTKQGTATILAGATSVTVTLEDASSYSIIAMAAYNVNVWITNKTATSFDINISAALAADLTVDWIAER